MYASVSFAASFDKSKGSAYNRSIDNKETTKQTKLNIGDCGSWEIAEYKIIFTKLDETTSFGNILNIRLYSGADLSYMTNGQSVPDDLEVFNTQMVVKQLLGGK